MINATPTAMPTAALLIDSEYTVRDASLSLLAYAIVMLRIEYTLRLQLDLQLAYSLLTVRLQLRDDLKSVLIIYTAWLLMFLG